MAACHRGPLAGTAGMRTLQALGSVRHLPRARPGSLSFSVLLLSRRCRLWVRLCAFCRWTGIGFPWFRAGRAGTRWHRPRGRKHALASAPRAPSNPARKRSICALIGDKPRSPAIMTLARPRHDYRAVHRGSLMPVFSKVTDWFASNRLPNVSTNLRSGLLAISYATEGLTCLRRNIVIRLFRSVVHAPHRDSA